MIVHDDPDALLREGRTFDGQAGDPNGRADAIRATPFQWRDPATIAVREWLFGKHAIRKFVSATVAAGGSGKTANAMAEQVAFVTGKNLLNNHLTGHGRAWYIGLEDPFEEYERRIAGLALYYGIDPHALTEGLFLDSGRDQDFVIAREDRNGLSIAEPIIAAIKSQIVRHNIALLTVDPFVASHSVRESDNGAVEAVARIWASIADETGAAIELIHHVRKTAPGQELSADDARGARALVDKARSVRLLTGMTKDEAKNAGVDERRRFFRITFGKANLTLPPDEELWRQLASVSLGNGNGGPDDHVGVAASWSWPNPLDDVSASDLAAVQQKLATGDWRASVQANAWAGNAVAEVLGLNISEDRSKAAVKSLLKTWIANGALKVENRTDPGRRDIRAFVVPAE